MDSQTIIVILILAITVAVVIHRLWKVLTGKSNGCSCGCGGGKCPVTGEDECHCNKKH